jgi:hypothetical protein
MLMMCRIEVPELLAVVVGSDQTRFYIPMTLACEHSDFIRAACQGPWKESQERTIHLPEVEYDTFFAYNSWLRHGRIINYDFQIGTQYNLATRRDDALEMYGLIINAYAFADFISDVRYRTMLTDTLRGIYKRTGGETPDKRIINDLCRRVPRRSPMLRALVDMMVAVDDVKCSKIWPQPFRLCSSLRCLSGA